MFWLMPLSRWLIRPHQQPQAFRTLASKVKNPPIKKYAESQPLDSISRNARKVKRGSRGEEGIPNVSKRKKKIDTLESPDSTLPSLPTEVKRKKKETLETSASDTPISSSKSPNNEKDASEKIDSGPSSLPTKKTRKKKEKLEYPDSSNSNHHDLSSFQEYVAKTSMDQTSTTYVGTHYEYMVQIALSRLGMSLQRIGGKSDYGIDLLGTWKLPSSKQPFKILIQCKAFVAKVRPSVVRELEGAFVGAPPGWRDPDVLGFLVSQTPATKGVREALGRSRWPMGYVLCENDGSVSQIIWNRKAAQVGLDGIEVEARYLGGEQNRREALLTWKGKPI